MTHLVPTTHTALLQPHETTLQMGTLLNDDDSCVSLQLEGLLSQHIGVSGGSGLGKSYLSESIFRQIITLQHDRPIPGAAIFDPNGDLVNRLLLYIRENPGKVHPQVISNLHVLEPASDTLFSIDPFDPSYYQHIKPHKRRAWIEAQAERVGLGIIRARGEHSFKDMPRLEKWMKILLIVAGTPYNDEGDHFPLGEIHVLYDPTHPQHNATYKLIRPHLSDRVRQRFDQLKSLSAQRLEETLDSTISRFESFFSETVRRLFARESTTIQIPSMVSDGAWVLINLQDSDEFTPERADAVGSILLTLFLRTIMSRPKHERRRFILWIDEASRFTGGQDIVKALKESRKYQLTCGLCIQDLSALVTEQTDILRQFLNCRTHFCFGQRAEEDLKLLASVLAFPNLSFDKLNQIGNISLNEYAPIETVQTTQTREQAITTEQREGQQVSSAQRIANQAQLSDRHASIDTDELSEAQQFGTQERRELATTDQTEDYQDHRIGIEVSDGIEQATHSARSREVVDAVQIQQKRDQQRDIVLGHTQKIVGEHLNSDTDRETSADQQRRTVANDAQQTKRKSDIDRKSDESIEKKGLLESSVKDSSNRNLVTAQGASYISQQDVHKQEKEDSGYEDRSISAHDVQNANEQAISQRKSNEQSELDQTEHEHEIARRQLHANEDLRQQQFRVGDSIILGSDHTKRELRSSGTKDTQSHLVKQAKQQASGQKISKSTAEKLLTAKSNDLITRHATSRATQHTIDLTNLQTLENNKAYGQHVDWINSQADVVRSTTTVKTDMTAISRIIEQDSGRLVDAITDQLYRFYVHQSMLGVGEVAVAHNSQVVSIKVDHVHEPYEYLTPAEHHELLLSLKQAIAAKHPTYFEYESSEGDDETRILAWLTSAVAKSGGGTSLPTSLPEGF